MAEGFLDDHAPPRAICLAGESGTSELLDDGTEESIGDSKVEEHIAALALARVFREHRIQSRVRLGLREISLQIGHALRKPGPGSLVNFLGVELTTAGERGRLHHLRDALPPGLSGAVTMVDADD